MEINKESMIRSLQQAHAEIMAGNKGNAFGIIESLMQSRAEPNEILRFALWQLNEKRLDVAEEILNIILKWRPDCYDGFNLLGVIMKQGRRYEEAIVTFLKAAQVNPSVEMAWMNMGNVQILLDRAEEALHSFTMAVAARPNHAEALRLQASAYNRLQKYEQALSVLSLALSYEPDNLMIVIDLCGIFYNRQEYVKSLEIINNALLNHQEDVGLLRTKGMVLRQMKRVDEAVNVFKKALEIDPKEARSMVALGDIYHSSFNDTKKAQAMYYLADSVAPNDINILQKLCHSLLLTKSRKDGDNDLDEAVKIAYRLLELSPYPAAVAWVAQGVFLHALDHEGYHKLGDVNEMMTSFIRSGALTSLLLQMSRVKSIEDRLDLLEMHLVWGRDVEKEAAKKEIARKVRQRLNNKTRIGFFSSYLNNSPVGYFVWPILEYADRSKFELYCYSASPNQDHVQQLMAERSDKFTIYRDEHRSPEVAQSMADDQLDIVFEMGGVTNHHRIEAFAYRVAPIQASWLGYPQSIGLPTAIDYLVVDPYINPEDKRLIIEKPFMLPETWVALDKIGFIEAPIAPVIPEDKNGYITFGTLNAGYKFTLEMFESWGRIINMIPNSRFLCVRPDTRFKVFRDNFCKHMAKYGISRDRINFIATDVNHLNCYNEIDICLDTFPHTGGTTTCESLWMGVPVVTLVGPAFFERLSYSNLNNSGLGDLCAFTAEEYINIALRLVADKERRRWLRQNLRLQIRQNPLGQPERFVKNFTDKAVDVLGRG